MKSLKAHIAETVDVLFKLVPIALAMMIFVLGIQAVLYLAFDIPQAAISIDSKTAAYYVVPAADGKSYEKITPDMEKYKEIEKARISEVVNIAPPEVAKVLDKEFGKK